jgi:hypothetical protein
MLGISWLSQYRAVSNSQREMWFRDCISELKHVGRERDDDGRRETNSLNKMIAERKSYRLYVLFKKRAGVFY